MGDIGPGMGVLEAVGIAPEQEQVYQALIDQPSSTVREIVAVSHMARRKVQAALSTLETRGLLSRTPRQPSTYIPTPPVTAIELLVLQRQEDLARVRLAATTLDERLRTSSSETRTSLVEAVFGQQAMVQRFRQLQMAAKEELLVFDKPPYAMAPGQPNDGEIDALRRGVRVRAIYDRESLTVPGMLAEIEQLVEAGEEARATSGLPMKVAVADRRLGLMPLRPAEPRLEAAIFISESPLLDAIMMLFDTLWERANHLTFSTDKQPTSEDDGELSATDHRVLALLATGYDDATIARTLRMGDRTVGRHIRRLMDILHVQSRFQLGAEAARRGWLTG